MANRVAAVKLEHQISVCTDIEISIILLSID